MPEIYYLPSEAGYRDSSGNAYTRIQVSETWDIGTNSSLVTVRLQVKGDSLNLSDMAIHGSVSIGLNSGEMQSFITSGAVNCERGVWNDFTATGGATSFTFTVPHNADGSAYLSFRFNKSSSSIFYFGRSYNGRYYQINIDDGTTWMTMLYTIPRSSSLTVANGTLGTAQTLTINRASASFTHTIRYSCGDASGTVTTKSPQTAVSFTPPLSLAEQNTTGGSVTVSYTLITYSGNTEIGQSSASAVYLIPESVKPSVSPGWATAYPYNDGTKAEGIAAYVQGYSKAAVTFDSSKISLAGAYGATIAGYRIECLGQTVSASPYRTPTLPNPGAVAVLCTVTDSRGHSVSETLTVTVQAYAAPTVSDVTVYRCNSAGEASENGTYISVQAKATYSEIAQLNTVSLTAKYKAQSGEYGAAIPLVSEQRSIIGGGTLSTTTSYIVLIRITDALGNSDENTMTVPTAQAAFNLRDGGMGAAFGKFAETDLMLELPATWRIKIGNTTLSEAQLIALLDLL